MIRLSSSIEQGMSRMASRFGITSGELLVLDALYRLGPPYTTTPTTLKRNFVTSLAGVGKRLDGLAQRG
jgi:DNA-binding MarR family transcriptional regulator